MADSWQESVLELFDSEGSDMVKVSEQVRAVYAAHSESDPMMFYYVIVLPWIEVCTCPGFRFRTDCKHVRKVAEKSQG